MVRPSAASLNSLADLLREAQPLYTECRLIINYLDPIDGVISPALLKIGEEDWGQRLINGDAAPIPLTVFEPTSKKTVCDE